MCTVRVDAGNFAWRWENSFCLGHKELMLTPIQTHFQEGEAVIYFI